MNNHHNHNVGYACPHCKAEQKAKTQQNLLRKLIAVEKHITIDNIPVYVQKAFTQGERTENMWVQIQRIDFSKGVIIGILSNEPVYTTNVKIGDIIIVKFDDIINIHY